MSQDILSVVLRCVRLQGAVFHHVESNACWVSESPSVAEIAGRIMPGNDHLIAYHILLHGNCWVSLSGEPPVSMHEGDAVLFPRGDPHVMASEPAACALATPSSPALTGAEQLGCHASELGRPHCVPQLDAAHEPCGAALICGFFSCDANSFNPLLDDLPPLLHVPARHEGNADWIAHLIRFALTESAHTRPGSEALLERLSEAVFVELMCRYLEAIPEGQMAWLDGLRDRHVGRALALLHESPSEAWTIDKLAGRAGLSRSALHERFARFTGHAPMHYLARWRMQVAAGLLSQTSASVASIALEVGYESEAAFSRAFRRANSLPPATWRRRQSRVAGSSYYTGCTQKRACRKAIPQQGHPRAKEDVMTLTVTATYQDLMKATNAYDELISEGFPREKLYFDKEAHQVKVIVPDTSKPEVEKILGRHQPDDLWARPYEAQ